MGKRDARQFQQAARTHNPGWNIVELEVLESRRQLHRTVNALIQLAADATTTTGEIQQQLLLSVATFGNSFATQLVRSLQRNDELERQSIVWLLTVLDDKTTVPLLQQMSLDKRLSRPVRLSAALALAGMGATAEMTEEPRRSHLYAIS